MLLIICLEKNVVNDKYVKICSYDRCGKISFWENVIVDKCGKDVKVNDISG